MDTPKKILIGGAGITGATCARRLAEAGVSCVICEKSSAPGGNCKTARDADTGIMVHLDGPHIFNTNDESAWEWANRFTTMKPFINKVKALTPNGMFSLPINLLTINQFFGKAFGPEEAKTFIGMLAKKEHNPENFEEAAIATLGVELYFNFFQGYTQKQWGAHPSELPASIFYRLPIRFNYNDNYYDSRFQAIPENGYSTMIETMLDHPLIKLNTNQALDPKNPPEEAELIIHTGPIDGLFKYQAGPLSYRTMDFTPIATTASDFQGCAVINDTRPEIAWTRTCEYKHFTPWDPHQGTVVIRETSRETQIGETAHYPKRLESDMKKLAKYEILAKLAAKKETANEMGFPFPVITAGRLGRYQYINMDQAITAGLTLADSL